jgi:D-alanyl-D-alanine carboxypeptidase/D-alanyl-D-alanine-endopeptidase (penicillin-binding protein 4)
VSRSLLAAALGVGLCAPVAVGRGRSLAEGPAPRDRPDRVPARARGGVLGDRGASLATGRTLYSLNADHAFRPASTLKLVTTAAALDAYGADARLRTSVETAGRLDALGRVLGDVFLVGRTASGWRSPPS